MRYEPPAHLVATLEELGLCDRRGLRAVRPRVRRLTRDLPAFDQVWIDALVQVRRITPFQGQLLAASQGKRLAVGPFVLIDRLGGSDLGETYLARPAGRGRRVALKVLNGDLISADVAGERLEPVLKQLAGLKCRHVATATSWGVSDGKFYIASPWVCGPHCREILIHSGRMAPAAVGEVARQLLAGLVRLWSAGLAHGDVRPSHVRISAGGKVMLTDAGIRLALPEAALLGLRGLPPECFDYLSPESFGSGQASTPAADQYALGCVLWHLLGGRPPLPGADADAKRVARQRGDVPDIRAHAPATPKALAELIAQLTRRDPAERPEDYGALLRGLGPSSGTGRRQLARMGKALGRRWRHQRRSRGRLLVSGLSAAAATGAVVLAVSAGAEGPWRDTLARLPLWGASSVQEKAARPGLPTVRGGNRGSQVQRPVETVGGMAGGAEEVVLLGEPVYRVQGGSLRPAGRGGHRLAPGAGTRMVGSQGNRPVIVLEEGPLHITEAAVQWENVRFVLARTAAATGDEPGPLVVVGAAGCRFRRCTFEVQDAHAWPTALVLVEGVAASFEECEFAGPAGAAQVDGRPLPAGVAWRQGDSGDAALLEPGGRTGVDISDCTLQGLSTGVVVSADGLPEVRLQRSMFRGPGVLVRTVVQAGSQGRISIRLVGCTTYDAEAVVGVGYGTVPQEWPGAAVWAQDCEFHFDEAGSGGIPGGTLVSFRGAEPTEALLRKVLWSGTGSAVIAPEPIPAAAWDRGDQTVELERRLVEQMPIEGISWGRVAPRRADGGTQ